MTRIRDAARADLFGDGERSDSRIERLAEGAVVLRGFAALEAAALMEMLQDVLLAAPFRHMVTPGGFRMSVAMTNCGRAGWITDRRGYRYDPLDPTTGRPWPPLPGLFRRLATRAAAGGDLLASNPTHA